jgi:hypothetical protein
LRKEDLDEQDQHNATGPDERRSLPGMPSHPCGHSAIMARHELRGEIATTAAALVELRQARKWPPKIGRPAQDNDASGREVARHREQDS